MEVLLSTGAYPAYFLVTSCAFSETRQSSPANPANCLQPNCLLGGNMTGGNWLLCIHSQNASTIYIFLIVCVFLDCITLFDAVVFLH